MNLNKGCKNHPGPVFDDLYTLKLISLNITLTKKGTPATFFIHLSIKYIKNNNYLIINIVISMI